MLRHLIPIQPATPCLYKAATEIAAAYHLTVVNSQQPGLPLLLYLTQARLELRDMSAKVGGPVYADFIGGALDYRRRYGGGRKQALAKAIGLKHGATPTIIDATAGLGRDAFILATLGCHVQMLERSPVIAALLNDGLQRARADSKIGIETRNQVFSKNLVSEKFFRQKVSQSETFA